MLKLIGNGWVIITFCDAAGQPLPSFTQMEYVFAHKPVNKLDPTKVPLQSELLYV